MSPWIFGVPSCVYNVLPHVVLKILELFQDLILIILVLEVFIREYPAGGAGMLLFN